MDDLISRKAVLDMLNCAYSAWCTDDVRKAIEKISVAVDDLPSAQHEPREVVPHRNYQYLSDYWCECGWHLGKKGDVKYCPDCGRKVKWDG